MLIPDWALCGATSSPPEMRMYFHDGIRDYILFKTAVPKSRGAHSFGRIPVCLATVFIHSLRDYRGDVYSAYLLW
jgi:hypothetical protein